MGLTDSESMARKEELFQWIEAHSGGSENQRALDDFIEKGIEEQGRDMQTLRAQIDGEYQLLPVAYIAKHYFGKSRAWLYQRLNGSKIRGKSYTLNEDQKRVFNEAVQDIARTIGSVRLV